MRHFPFMEWLRGHLFTVVLVVVSSALLTWLFIAMERDTRGCQGIDCRMGLFYYPFLAVPLVLGAGAIGVRIDRRRRPVPPRPD
jgi:hypothetical protein